MKHYFRHILCLCLLILALCIVPNLAISQPCNDPNDPFPDTDLPTCPVDGGLSILVAAGIGYGIKKVRDERKRGVA